MKLLALLLVLLLFQNGLPAMAQTNQPIKKSIQPAKKTVQKSSRITPKRQPVTPVVVQPPVLPLIPLGEAELELAKLVFVGRLPCENRSWVTVESSPHGPGYFQLRTDNLTYHMAPVATTTGAIRLEDRRAQVTWLQLANKSMLVSDKLGRRLVDACMNPDQIQFAQEMVERPRPSVLDPEPEPAPTSEGAVAQR